MRENIFKIMRKLYQLNTETVAAQIQSNKDFAKAIVVHINSGDKKKISDNCFYLLTQLFNKSSYKEEINEEFIAALFEGLGLVREEDILNAIVVILIEINFEYKSEEENLFIKVHKENDNARVLNEILLRVLNNEDDEKKQIKILKCLDDLMSSYEKSIFYESDLESFVDILLPKLQMTENNELKQKLLKCLDRVTKYDEYYRQMYKVEDITELMEDFESAENQSDEVRSISKQIVINITDRQGKNKQV
jgi:predicted DNA-binding protein